MGYNVNFRIRHWQLTICVLSFLTFFREGDAIIFCHVVFIYYFCRRFGRPTRAPRGKPVQVRRSPAAVCSNAEAQQDKSLCNAIVAWEDGAEGASQKTCQTSENRYRFRGKSTPVTEDLHSMQVFFPPRFLRCRY